MNIVKHGLVYFKNNSSRPRPSLFSFPGITAKPFWRIEDLDNETRTALEDVVQNKEIVMEEYWKMKQNKDNDYVMAQDEKKLHTGSWNWRSFVQKGNWQSEMQMQCPETTKLLKNIPSLMTDIPFGYAFYSNLKPLSTISPHFGPMNLRVRAHLPLLLPTGRSETKPDFGIKVAGERSCWKEGEIFLFDDQFLHETWNVSTPHSLYN